MEGHCSWLSLYTVADSVGRGRIVDERSGVRSLAPSSLEARVRTQPLLKQLAPTPRALGCIVRTAFGRDGTRFGDETEVTLSEFPKH